MGHIYALWFQALGTFNPLFPYASPLGPLDSLTPQDSPQDTPPLSPPALDFQTRQVLVEILAKMRAMRTDFWWRKGIHHYNLEEFFEEKFILKCSPEMIACSLDIRQTINPEIGKYVMVIIQLSDRTLLL